ncbi:ferredoxin [Stigmatella aurantiaca]|uniref:Ferredoxin n=1 Tax=Stigmatella aurantiaca TaxID=41 RepID=A0A1H7QA17_STIAU|nr:ferredoxin [Stigmatella aurantiaca]SEL44950.1 ferredoxin [Stigmatella aurantiaca]
MKIVLDENRCEANGVCVRAAPEAFFLDAQDSLHLLSEQVTPRLRVQMERAVRECPRQALSLVGEGPVRGEATNVL